MIYSRMVFGIFLIFCRSRFINNFVVKNNFSEPWNQKLYISRHIHFEKFSRRILKILSLQKAGRIFFQKYFFIDLVELFSRLQNHSFLGVICFHKKLTVYFISSANNFIKTFFKNLFKKTRQKWWFNSLKQVTRTLSYLKTKKCYWR